MLVGSDGGAQSMAAGIDAQAGDARTPRRKIDDRIFTIFSVM
jgi:hypothetical protein